MPMRTLPPVSMRSILWIASAVDHSLHRLRVPRTLHRDRRCSILDFTEVAGRQLDRRCADVLFQPLDLPSARDRNDPRLLRQQPRQRDLCRGRFLALGNFFENIDDSLIRLPILRRKSRDGVAEVGAVERRSLVDLSGEEAFAERAERNEADAELFAGRQYFLLGLSPPQRVFALNG